MMQKEMYTKISGDEIELWIEQRESLCIKAVSKPNDPVELSCNEAKKLAAILLIMVSTIEDRDGS